MTFKEKIEEKIKETYKKTTQYEVKQQRVVLQKEKKRIQEMLIRLDERHITLQEILKEYNKGEKENVLEKK